LHGQPHRRRTTAVQRRNPHCRPVPQKQTRGRRRNVRAVVGRGDRRPRMFLRRVDPVSVLPARPRSGYRAMPGAYRLTEESLIKKCARCKEEKLREDFRPLKNRRHPYCRKCESAHAKERREAKKAAAE